MKKAYFLLLICLLFNNALFSMKRSREDTISRKLEDTISRKLLANAQSAKLAAKRITKEIEVGLERDSTIKCYVIRVSRELDAITDTIFLPSQLVDEKSLSDIINILNHPIKPSNSSEDSAVCYVMKLPFLEEESYVLGRMSKPDKLQKVSTFLEDKLLPLVKKYMQAKLENKISRENSLKAYKECFRNTADHMHLFLGMTSMFTIIVLAVTLSPPAYTRQSLIYASCLPLLFYVIAGIFLGYKKGQHLKLEAAAYRPKPKKIKRLEKKICAVLSELDKMFVNREQGKITERIALAE